MPRSLLVYVDTQRKQKETLYGICDMDPSIIYLNASSRNEKEDILWGDCEDKR